MIIIKNGALVTPQGLRRADLAMEGDKIVRIAAAIEPAEGDTVEDAVGCRVFPGFIDGHTHMQCWTGMDWTADSFETGTRAAACGGTTTIVDYATADRGVTMPDALAEWHRRADGTCTANYAFHMALAEWNERNRADLSAMREAGVSSFKTYFAYDHLRLDDAETLEVLEELKCLGGILCGCVRGRGSEPSAVSGAPGRGRTGQRGAPFDQAGARGHPCCQSARAEEYLCRDLPSVSDARRHLLSGAGRGRLCGRQVRDEPAAAPCR